MFLSRACSASRRSRDLDRRMRSIRSADFDRERLFERDRDLLRLDILRGRMLRLSDSAFESGSWLLLLLGVVTANFFATTMLDVDDVGFSTGSFRSMLGRLLVDCWLRGGVDSRICMYSIVFITTNSFSRNGFVSFPRNTSNCSAMHPSSSPCGLSFFSRARTYFARAVGSASHLEIRRTF